MERNRNSALVNSISVLIEASKMCTFKKIVLFFQLVLLSIGTHAQDYKYQWGHSLLDSMLPNGVLVSNITTPAKTINEMPEGVAVDNSGNVVIAGHMKGSYYDLSPITKKYETNGSTIFIQKTNTNGTTLWSNYIDGGNYGATSAIRTVKDVVIDNQDNIYICGYLIKNKGLDKDTTDFDPGPGEALVILDTTYVGYIAKYTKDGDFSFVYTLYGNGIISPHGISVDDNDNVLVTGVFTQDLDFDAGSGIQRDTSYINGRDFLLKIDSSCQYIWHKTWAKNTEADAWDIAVDDAGNSYIVCDFNDTIDTDPGAGTNMLIPGDSTGVFESSYVTKFDASGNFVWSTLLKSDSSCVAIKLDYSKSKVAVIGSFRDPIEVIRGTSTQLIPEVTPTPSNNAFVVCLDTLGQYLWHYTPQLSQTDCWSSVSSISSNGEGWNIGMTVSDSLDIDNGPGVAKMYHDFSTMYVVGLSETGQYQWNRKFELDANTDSDIRGITTKGKDLYTVGFYKNATLDVNPNPLDTVLLPQWYSFTTYLVKLSDHANYPPTITNFTPKSGPVGTSVTISGTNFDTIPANNIVFFGATQTAVTSASSSQLIVTVPPGTTYQPITVAINGLVAESAQPFKVTFESRGIITQSMFDSSQFFDAGYPAYEALPGDLDGDGLSDLVVSDGYDSTISILHNISSGTGNINFASKADFIAAGEAVDILLADFDGDGKLDVAVSYFDYPGISIFRNNSDSLIKFDTRQDFTLSSYSSSIAAGDLNGDGRIDLAAIDMNNDSLYILTNTSTGTGSINFILSNSLITGDEPVSVAISDIDQDQLPDLLVANNTDVSLSILLNAGSNTFSAKQDFSLVSNPWNIVTGDMDGDSVVDIGVACEGYMGDPNAMVRLFMNNSTPGNLSLASFNISGVAPEWMVFEDINGDEKTDILCTNFWEDSLVIFRNTSVIDSFRFDPKVTIDLKEVSPYAVFCGDLDNDGKPDIIVPGYSSVTFLGGVEILRSPRSGNSFKSFSFAEQKAPATIDTVNHTIDIDVHDCTDLTTLVATFTLSPGASTVIPSGTGNISLTSGVTPHDYSDTVYFLVTSEDEQNQIWSVTVNMNFSTNSVTENIVECESYMFNGNLLSSTGQYQATFTNQTGCDSIVTLNLTILEPSTGTDVISACKSYTWIDGITYTTSNNTATDTLTNSVGCDSVVTLNLTIHEPSTGTDVISACESYTWIDGITYTQSNDTATYTLTNSVGCDSVVTLNLTILEPSTGTDVVSACKSYTWIDGITYTQSNNTATYTLSNAVGCDSVVTLNLTIHTINLNTSINGSTISSDVTGAAYQWLDCDDDMAVIPGETNQDFTASSNGNYAVEIIENGCMDTTACVSITTINVIQNSFTVKFIIYPNPVTDYLIIEQSLTSHGKIEIIDVLGNIVLTKMIDQNKIILKNLNLNSGIYFLKLYAENQKLHAIKFIKN